MLDVVFKKQSARDLKLAVKRGKSLEKINAVIDLLCAQQPLPQSLRDQALSGNYSGYRDCHIEPDLVLIYRIVQNQLQLVCVRLGSHSDLF